MVLYEMTVTIIFYLLILLTVSNNNVRYPFRIISQMLFVRKVRVHKLYIELIYHRTDNRQHNNMVM